MLCEYLFILLRHLTWRASKHFLFGSFSSLSTKIPFWNSHVFYGYSWNYESDRIGWFPVSAAPLNVSRDTQTLHATLLIMQLCLSQSNIHEKFSAVVICCTKQLGQTRAFRDYFWQSSIRLKSLRQRQCSCLEGFYRPLLSRSFFAVFS